MKRKQLLVLILVVAVLAALVYLQVRTWRHFDWEKFAEGTEGVNYWKVLVGVLLIHVADFLRAIRWKIFLRPTRPDASWTSLVAPQFVGFAGLALLGRPGELIRPYLLSLRTGTSFSSQLAIWAVERVFDISAVTIILLLDIFLAPSIREIHHYQAFRDAGYALVGILALLILSVFAVSFFGSRVAAWLRRALSPISTSLADGVERRICAFSDGLNTLHSFVSFLEVLVISLGLWFIVALAYRQVTHAYPLETGLPYLDLPQVILLMGASVAGGVLQLPVVGGGSQLATIAVMDRVFEVGPELAVSAGIMFWLVTFMSVAPLGLVLARHEHVSLRKLTRESENIESAEERGSAQASSSPLKS
ncbi:MAG TPA: lysylphosphatidylglycerol synthase transmembrane domain-containing protein [Terriglobales bacterium]|nr:lysylphosphatidylglycerol synthase transmembrane domain-containing protein [Terriglobales bacterium]